MLFLAIGVLLFPSAGRDDVYISYWAAHTLSVFGEIVNYNGDRIEQSSSLLHVLILAFLHTVSGIRLPVLGLGVSVTAGLATIWLSGRLALRLGLGAGSTAVLVATAVPLLYWSFAKLEASLVAVAVLMLLIAVLNAGALASRKRFVAACAAIAVYQLLRPEAFIVTTLFLLLLASVDFRQGRSVRTGLQLALVSVLFFIILTAWRYWYFGSLFPLPVEAKVDLSVPGGLLSGHVYFLKALLDYPMFLPLSLPLLIILFRARVAKLDRRVTTVALFISVYLLFIYLSGGDWMEGGRFFVPLVAPMIVLAIHCYRNWPGSNWLLAGGLSLNLGFVLLFAWRGSSTLPLFDYRAPVPDGAMQEDYLAIEKMNRTHYRDLRFLDGFKDIVRKVGEVREQPLILSRQAGMVPYYVFMDFYGKARFTDFLSLTTREFLNCDLTRQKDRGRHGMWINYRYYFKALWALQKQCGMQMPDIIFDIDNPNLDRVRLVEAYNYQVVFLQTGQVPQHGLLKGKKVEYTQFAAVRKDLLQEVQIIPRHYDFEKNLFY